MAELTVRDVDDEVVAALKRRDAANGRSAEAEHRRLLREALLEERHSIHDFKAAAARLRARIGRLSADAPSSEELVREMRDGR